MVERNEEKNERNGLFQLTKTEEPYTIGRPQQMLPLGIDKYATRVKKGEDIKDVAKGAGTSWQTLQALIKKYENREDGKTCATCRYAHAIPDGEETILCTCPYDKEPVIMFHGDTCGYREDITVDIEKIDAAAKIALDKFSDIRKRRVAALWLSSADKEGFAKLYNYLAIGTIEEAFDIPVRVYEFIEEGSTRKGE